MVAGCQVEPPSVDTSTPATTPPPGVCSPAPLIVTVLPFATTAPPDGEVIVEVGGVRVGGLGGIGQAGIE